jgi:hypothetical protein
LSENGPYLKELQMAVENAVRRMTQCYAISQSFEQVLREEAPANRNLSRELADTACRDGLRK